MGKIQLLVTILLLTAGSGIVEGHATKQGDALYERFVNYGLRSQTDSIYAGKDKALAYFADHHQWEYYYYVANLAIQMKVLREDQPMAGLRECRELYNFAIGHHHDYGRASVLAQMGWLYGYIGDHAEAAAQLKESLGELRRHKPTLAILGIYYIYAYMLELTHDYDEELRVVEEGKQLWTQLSNDIDTTSLAYRTVHDNLLNVETLMEVRRGNLDKAGILVARLEHKLATNNEMTRYEALRAIAEYYLARKDYEKALAVTDEMQQNAGHLQISVESSLPEGFTIRSNANALSKILARLMSNALKFTEQGRVTVRLYEAGGLLKIEVEDTGIGIPPDHQEKIFERFYKVDTFKQGIGLGLTVARRATELLGGTLTLDGNYTAGARFVVTLTDPSAQASRRVSN